MEELLPINSGSVPEKQEVLATYVNCVSKRTLECSTPLTQLCRNQSKYHHAESFFTREKKYVAKLMKC